uniref:Uncharacterized protein n=1 Tax=Oryza meridionalis TaxID=40149 RepID=A0A0E0BZQ3_9ORYZ
MTDPHRFLPAPPPHGVGLSVGWRFLPGGAGRGTKAQTSTTRNLRLAVDGAGTNNQTRTWRSFWKILYKQIMC